MEGKEKPVYFENYCITCKHFDKKENEEPCYTCLNNFSNIDTHRPTEYKEKGK